MTSATRVGPAKTRRQRFGTSPAARGESMLWLAGGALALCLAMMAGAMLLVLGYGLGAFWPQPLAQIRTKQGSALLGEVVRREPIGKGVDSPGSRRLLRTGNFDVAGTHFEWVNDVDVLQETQPEGAVLLERLEWGRFYGFPKSLEVSGKVVASSPNEIVDRFPELHAESVKRWHEMRRIEASEIGVINRRLESERLELRTAKLRNAADLPSREARVADAARQAEEKIAVIANRVAKLREENERYRLKLTTAAGAESDFALYEIVRMVPANRLGIWQKCGVYLDRWREFLLDEPREANAEGGVLPAIAGTVAMTLIMCVVVVPLGVLAALYLREYAARGPVVAAVRIAVANLAGVPSIVFGVFGLGFFCYLIGANIDQLLYQANLPNPTYGKGGLLWASLTLALLTLPVVIVATEEAIAAVPRSMREGSFGCGASKWQTIHRIVLPQAMPGVVTGVILAIARGAGEVAPLMLVGAVKLTHEWPLDGEFPYMHGTRSFMHLGFHVYDLGFQSPNSEAARPLVFATTLLLIGIVAVLNLSAVSLRNRLRRRFLASKF